MESTVSRSRVKSNCSTDTTNTTDCAPRYEPWVSREPSDEAPGDETSERVRAVMKERGIRSVRELGRLAGLGEEYTVKLVARGLSRAGSANVLKIADALNVNYRWLVTGEGERDLPPAPPETVVVYDARYPNLEKALRPIEHDLHPRIPPHARSAAFNSYRDLSVLEWTRWLLREDERMRFEEAHPAEVAAKLVTAETAKGAEKLGPPPAKDPSGRAKKK